MSSPDENTPVPAASEPQNTPAKPKKAKAPAKKPAAKKTAAPAKKPAAKKTAAPAKKPAAKKGSKDAPKTKRGQGSKFINGPLYQMVKKALPKTMINAEGGIDFKKLSKEVKTSMEGVYKWFRTNHLAPDKAVRLMRASKGKLKHRDFDKFVYPSK